MSYKQKLERYRDELEGWGFSLPSPKVPRAFSTNVSNESTTNHPKEDSEWCYYAGMPSPTAYMDDLER